MNVIELTIAVRGGKRFIWSASGAFLGVYAIVQDISIPVSVLVRLYAPRLTACPPSDHRPASALFYTRGDILGAVPVLSRQAISSRLHKHSLRLPRPLCGVGSWHYLCDPGA
jgi:hypothetical protein